VNFRVTTLVIQGMKGALELFHLGLGGGVRARRVCIHGRGRVPFHKTKEDVT